MWSRSLRRRTCSRTRPVLPDWMNPRISGSSTPVHIIFCRMSGSSNTFDLLYLFKAVSGHASSPLCILSNLLLMPVSVSYCISSRIRRGVQAFGSIICGVRCSVARNRREEITSACTAGGDASKVSMPGGRANENSPSGQARPIFLLPNIFFWRASHRREV